MMSDEFIQAEISAADKQLVDAFIRRLRAIRAIQEARGHDDKTITANLAGDAANIRRFIETAPSDIPPDAVARFCRAFIGECVTYQGVKTVAFAQGDEQRMVNAARGYFGYGVTLEPASDWRAALEMVMENDGMVGCLPWPELPGAGQWWPALIEDRFHDLKILAGWPNLPGPDTPLEAALIARRNLEPSGSDDMLLIAHDDMHDAERLLRNAEIPGEVTARVRSQALIRVNGYIAEDDLRIAHLRAAGLDGLRVVGILSHPVSSADEN